MPAEVLYVRNDASSDFFRGKIADNVTLLRDKPKTVLGSYGFVAVVDTETAYGQPVGVEVFVTIDFEKRMTVVVVTDTIGGKSEPTDAERLVVSKSIDGIARQGKVGCIGTIGIDDLSFAGVNNIGSVPVGGYVQQVFSVGVQIGYDGTVQVDVRFGRCRRGIEDEQSAVTCTYIYTVTTPADVA